MEEDHDLDGDRSAPPPTFGICEETKRMIPTNVAMRYENKMAWRPHKPGAWRYQLVDHPNIGATESTGGGGGGEGGRSGPNAETRQLGM